jgi:hypothetical protein
MGESVTQEGRGDIGKAIEALKNGLVEVGYKGAQ